MKKINKKLIITIFLTLLISGFIFIPYIVSDKAYIIGWDMRTQYSSFYVSFKNIIENNFKNSTVPLYSFNYFLGNDFYSSKLFYYHDIFDFIFAFTNLKYTVVVMLQTFIKFIISSVCMYKLLKYNNFNNKFIVVGSLLYTFSSYSLDVIKDPFFHSFVIFIPLYLYSINRYLKESRYNLFIIISVFLIVTNYYFFFGLSIFTVIYYVYIYITYKISLNNFIKKTLFLVACYFVAILISGVVLLPEALYLLDNSRLSESSSLLFYPEIKTYFSIIMGMFFPFSITCNRLYEFSSVYRFVTKYNSVLNVFIYTSSICSILIPYAIIKDKISRYLYVVLYLILFIPILSSVFQGFSEPTFRWLHYFTLMNILTCGRIFDENIDFRLVKKILFVVIVMIIISTPTLAYIYNINAINEYKYHLFIILILLVSYFILKHKKYIVYFICIELGLISYFSVFDNSFYREFDKAMINSVTGVLGEYGELDNYLKSIDNSFYRVYIDISSIYWDYSNNLNLNYGFKSVNSYDSTINPFNIKLNSFSEVSTYLPWSMEIKDIDLLNFVNCKYSLSLSEDSIPFKNYELIGYFKEIPVYKNLDIGDFVKSYNLMKQYSTNNNLDDLVVEGELKFNGKADIKMYYINVLSNQINFGFNSSKVTAVNIPIPYEKGFNLFLDGKKTPIYNSNGGFITFITKKGYQDVELKFLPHGLKQGLGLSVLGVVLLVLLNLKRFILKEH